MNRNLSSAIFPVIMVLLFSSCQREFLNPYDSQTPPDVWMPVDFTYTITGNNAVELAWTQPNELIDGFTVIKRKNGIEKAIDLDKSARTYEDNVVLDSAEMSICTPISYSIFAKAGAHLSATASLPESLVFLQPSVAYAGTDQAPTGLSALLNANVAAVNETGHWTIVSGAGGILQNPEQPSAQFYGYAGTNYILRWIIEGACASSFDDVTISLPSNPIGNLVSSNDCSNLSGVTTQYQGLNGNTAEWTISSNGYSGSSFVAPDNSLGGLLGNAIGTHFVQFTVDLTGPGYIEFWKYTYYAGSQNIQPVIFIDGIQQSSPTILETQNTYWQRVKTANVAAGAHTVRIQFSSNYYQLKVDEIKVFQF